MRVWLAATDALWAPAVVELTSCQQHESVVLERGEGNNYDAEYYVVSGRLKGCAFRGDWWVRSEPLHGYGEVFESRVDPVDGGFRIVAVGRGRELIVVGKGRQPVTAFAKDLSASVRDRDVGVIEIGDFCPSEEIR